MAYSFLHLENHHNIKEDLGGLMERESHKQERVVLMSQMKELQKVLQALKVMFAVCIWLCTIVRHVSFGLSQDVMNETCQCACNGCEINLELCLLKRIKYLLLKCITVTCACCQLCGLLIRLTFNTLLCI